MNIIECPTSSSDVGASLVEQVASGSTITYDNAPILHFIAPKRANRTHPQSNQVWQHFWTFNESATENGAFVQVSVCKMMVMEE
jgi:hypothetical protein